MSEFSKEEIKKIKKMPAIQRRKRHIKNLEELPDGTIQLKDDCKILKCKDGKGYLEIYELFSNSRLVQYAMDLSDEPYIEKSTEANLTIVDEDGIEKELYTKKAECDCLEEWRVFNFNEINARNGKRVLRKNGLIKEQEVKYRDTGKITVESEREYYDVGECFLESIYGEERSTKSTRIGLLLSELQKNRDWIKSKNPELNSVIRKTENNLLNNIEDRYLKVSFANVKLDAEYYRSKAMKESIIGFIELVRDNFLGHLFLGKEAENLVGKRKRI